MKSTERISRPIINLSLQISVVKKEIDNLKAKLSGQSGAQEPEREKMVVTAPVDTEDAVEASSESLKWDGDFKREKDGKVSIYVMEANVDQNVFMSAKMHDPIKSYPNGLQWRFEYMTEDYTGTGFEVRFEFPNLLKFIRTGSAIRPDGKWTERTLPFNDLKGEELINFQIHLTPGEGTVRFRNIELISK